jgi:hypothetical protein
MRTWVELAPGERDRPRRGGDRRPDSGAQRRATAADRLGHPAAPAGHGRRHREHRPVARLTRRELRHRQDHRDRRRCRSPHLPRPHARPPAGEQAVRTASGQQQARPEPGQRATPPPRRLHSHQNTAGQRNLNGHARDRPGTPRPACPSLGRCRGPPAQPGLSLPPPPEPARLTTDGADLVSGGGHMDTGGGHKGHPWPAPRCVSPFTGGGAVPQHLEVLP